MLNVFVVDNGKNRSPNPHNSADILDKGWHRAFDHPIPLRRGRVLDRGNH
jgi:hypothetical protein